MQKYPRFIILTMLFIFWGCSTLKVSQDYDLKANLSGLKTYAWQSKTHKETGDVRVDNPLLHSRIRSAVDFYLLGKGYRKVSQGAPDFYVKYQYSVRSKIESDNLDGGVGFGIGTYGRHGGIGVGVLPPFAGQLVAVGIGGRDAERQLIVFNYRLSADSIQYRNAIDIGDGYNDVLTDFQCSVRY